jgi:hypothetical protein
MGWGVQLMGLANTLDVFESLKVEWNDGAAYVAGPTVEYAAAQELGTESIEARPYMRPAAERVNSDPEKYAKQYGGGLDLSTEAGFVKALAIAVQNEGKKIADAKGVRDTGQLINSISIERIR